MGSDTNKLDTRDEDKVRTEKRLGELDQEVGGEMKIEELKGEYYKQINAEIEKRPFDLDKKEDGRYNYIHHLKARRIVDEILARFSTLEEKVKELEGNLYKKFSECYEVNKWTPESGFENQLDFYIHESWKREPVVAHLKAENASLKSQVEGLKKKLKPTGYHDVDEFYRE